MKFLFCLPFAGGNQYSFRELKNALPSSVTLVPIDYPGRGARLKEPLMSSLDGMAADVLEQVKGRLSTPYALYGHSMGAAIGFELAHKIRENGLPGPLHLFVSGRNAPSSPRRREPISHLPSAQFRAKIKELGGSPDEVLNNHALMELFEPILKNDFLAHETYSYTRRRPFDFPITAMYGDSEDLPPEEVDKWGLETGGPFDKLAFGGDHFFIFRHWKTIASYISENLTP